MIAPSSKSFRTFIERVLSALVASEQLPKSASVEEFSPSTAAIGWTEPSRLKACLFFRPAWGSFELNAGCRLVIRGAPDSELGFHMKHEDPDATITVKPTRGPEHIAHEIARRVLPVLRLNLVELSARRQVYLARLAEVDNLFTQLEIAMRRALDGSKATL